MIRRYHGGHWWHGTANEKLANGSQNPTPRWYVVHCWTHDAVCYATSAHWSAPMRQDEMIHGTWGHEVSPPNA